ncbi:MAG TPA: hypothetical protein VHS32_28465, partial [Streptosporangiaceae bacterium]|nr:hypothetical protein [Streptosporangiaceae bacterium]
MTTARVGLVGIVMLVVGMSGRGLAEEQGQPPKPPVAPVAGGWKEVDRLVSEQKLEAATAVIAKLRARAKEAGDEAEWTKALLREAELRV